MARALLGPPVMLALVAVPLLVGSLAVDPSHPDLRPFREAIVRFCQSPARVRRRYYDYSFAWTKARVCEDLSRCLRSPKGCQPTLEGPSHDQPALSTMHLSLLANLAEATYWEIDFAPRSRGWKITAVDYVEDCTGP